MEAKRGSTALQGSDAPLTPLFFVELLPLVDKGLAAGEHEVHHARQLVRAVAVFPVRDAPADEGGAALWRTLWCAVDVVSRRAERHTQPFARLNRTEARRLQGR